MKRSSSWSNNAQEDQDNSSDDYSSSPTPIYPIIETAATPENKKKKKRKINGLEASSSCTENTSSSYITAPSSSSSTVHTNNLEDQQQYNQQASSATSPSSSSFSYDEFFGVANSPTITNQEPPILEQSYNNHQRNNYTDDEYMFLPIASTDELIHDETASTDGYHDLPVTHSNVGEALIDSLFSSANDGFDYDFNEPSYDDEDVEEALPRKDQEEATSNNEENLMINSEQAPPIFNDAIGLILTHHNVDLTVCLQELRNLLNGEEDFTPWSKIMPTKQ